MNRKGTEKPIEIFVALFIILAVALVMLKLFQGQIAEKQKELADVQQDQKARELYNKVDQACKDKCVDASDDCSLASVAALCTFGSANVLDSNQFIDLNSDKVKGYDDTLLAGIGVCEDRVYCFHMLNSCCGYQITPQSCKTILREYWESVKIVPAGTGGDDEFEDLLRSTVKPGVCEDGDGDVDRRWDTLADWP